MFQNLDYTSTSSRDELAIISIKHPLFSADISYQGAQLFNYSNHANLRLWCSSKANFKTTKAIRGGIPLCWPWFGPKENSLSHGFARIFDWSLESIEEDALYVRLKWKLVSNNESQQYFPYQFELTLIQTLSKSISYTLHVKNCGEQSFETSEAFHTYFAIDDIEVLHVKALDNKIYYNQLTNTTESEKNIIVNKEIDRIFQGKFSCIKLEDSNHTVSVEQTNMHSVILWNPWIDKAKSLQDMDNNEYKNMICVESGNVRENRVSVASLETHTISLTLR